MPSETNGAAAAKRRVILPGDKVVDLVRRPV